MKTSAPGWARSRTNTPASPWRVEGYPNRWSWCLDRATRTLLQMSMDGTISQAAGAKFCFWPGQHGEMDLFELATSHPFLKKSLYLTSMRGNAPGPDGETFYTVYQTPDAYDRRLAELRGQIRSGEYTPGGLRRTKLRHSGRVLHIPNVTDRVVARAVGLALAPVFEPHFNDRSYGFRRGISIHHAIDDLMRLCAEHDRWVLRKLDIEKAFDRVRHVDALRAITRLVKDKRLVELITKFIRRPSWRNLDNRSDTGLAMGCPTSPIVFNIFIDHVLDHVLDRRHPDVIWLRYADDIMLVCRDNRQAAEHTEIVERILRTVGLTLNHTKVDTPEATADLKGGDRIEYLGFQIRSNRDGKMLLGVAESTYVDLGEQIIRDILDRDVLLTSDYKAKGEAISRLIDFRTAGWLEAYAPAITSGELGGLRKRLRRLFDTIQDYIGRDPYATERGFDTIQWPSPSSSVRGRSAPFSGVVKPESRANGRFSAVRSSGPVVV